MFDPSTMQHLARVRQREILEQSERDRAGEPLHQWRYQVGLALMRIGRRLAKAASVSPDREPMSPRIPRSLHSDS